MKTSIDAFFELARLFEIYHHHLYLVGGTVRDYLSNVPLSDMDCATDAKPEEMEVFLEQFDHDTTFAKMGCVKVHYSGYKFDITTFRKEGKYDDSRHPSKIKFIRSLKKDSKRRDFTLNAMYLDYYLKLIDPYHGYKDLKKRRLNMVGNPKKRLKEDPLRIIRAMRFCLTYNYQMVPKLDKAVRENIELLENLNKGKIKEELYKIRNASKEQVKEMFENYGIASLLKLVED